MKKEFRNLAAMGILVGLAFAMIAGCSTIESMLGSGSTASTTVATISSDIQAFDTWADKYIGGVLQDAPAVVDAGISVINAATGNSAATPTMVTAANDAINAAQAAVSTLDAATAVATSTPTTAQQAVLTAIGQVNSTIGAIQAVTAAASAPAAATTATPAK
jgi:uncharacterized protein YceK